MSGTGCDVRAVDLSLWFSSLISISSLIFNLEFQVSYKSRLIPVPDPSGYHHRSGTLRKMFFL